jgi:Tol biopolymer transport system component
LAGNGVIAVAKDGDILVADRPGGDLRPLVAGPEDDRSPMFSPDGTRLAFIRDTHPGSFLMVADADGTNLVAIPLEPLDLEYWSFAPDGRSLMAIGTINDDSRVFIRPVDPAAAPTVLDVRLLDASMLRSWATPTFNPMNAQEILVVAQLEPDAPRNSGGGLYVYDLATGGIRTIVEPADEQYFQDIAWLPDGEHIIYTSGGPRIVAADGSGDQAFDALRGRSSPLSNDGTKVVAEFDGEADAENRTVVVPINGDGEPVALACGSGTDIHCPSPPTDWIWSPDDSMLIGTVYDETSSGGLAETYLLVDANTGQVTELDWIDVGTPAWQRVAP